MSDFEQHNGVTYGQSYDHGASIEQERKALEERIDRLRFEEAKARHEREEADFNAKIAADTEANLRGNGYYQSLVRGESLNSGGTPTPAEAQRRAEAAANPATIGAPQALIDQLVVTVGGVELGPQQAKDMLARGEISQKDYTAAVNKALAPYGYSFR